MIERFQPDGAGESLSVATVGSVNGAGVTLILPGQTDATQKRYKRLVTGQSLTTGDLVLCARVSGSWVVLGRIAAYD